MKKVVGIALIILSLALALSLAACGAGAPTKIEVSAFPESLIVTQGAAPDLAGGKITVTYGDGSTKEVDMSELETRGLNSAKLGPQTLVLVYTEKGKSYSATLEMKVVAPKVTRLELSTESVKTAYLDGDSFDKTGLVVTAHYANGESETIRAYEVYPTKLSLETTKVKISYSGVVAEIPVTVVSKAPSEMTILTPPTKTKYFEREVFLPEGLSVSVTYNDGAEETFAADRLSYYHVNGGEYTCPMNANDTTVKLVADTAFGRAEGSLTLTVSAIVPSSIECTVNGSFLFTEGQFFSYGEEEEKISALVRYNNGAEERLIADVDHFSTADEPLSVGQTTVWIWLIGYEDVKGAVPVTVVAPYALSISVLTLPSKRSYTAGESVELDGLTLLASMSDGTNRTIEYTPESGITCDPEIVADDDTVTVAYEGVTTTFSIIL